MATDMAEYMKRRYNERIKLFHAHLGGSCKICGRTDGLEIDHVNPSLKTMNVARMTMVSLKRAMEELENCQLLCSDHHRKKTSAEHSVEHGGGKTGKRNCLCDLCKPLKAQYMRERRALKGR